MKTREGMVPPAAALALLALLAACGGPPREQAASKKPDLHDATSPLAPAIVAPEESGPAVEAPSYEVAIASAAADHNKALRRCEAMPETVRAQCQQEANAAFSESRDELQDLRGNQQ